jgi:DNA primase
LAFPEAIRLLAKRVNVTIPDMGDNNPQMTNTRQLIFKVNTLAAQYFHKNLIFDKGKSAKRARSYLKKRKIDLQAAEQFQLGDSVEVDGASRINYPPGGRQRVL